MMLRCECLTLRLGSFLLNAVNLDCSKGQSIALVGASGSGKTTCLEIMAGLCRAESGRVWIDGCDVTGLTPERRDIAYLPQDVALFPHLSVRQNIEFPARIRGVPLDRDRLSQICGMLGIDEHLDRRDIRSLSGGEAQRVALARALAIPPKVLFLDECFGSLDTPMRRRLARQFRQLQTTTATTTVVVTHDLEEASLMSDRLAVLHQGEIQQIGTVEALYQRPTTIAVAELLGMQNIFAVRSALPCGNVWECDLGGWQLCVRREGPAQRSQSSHTNFQPSDSQQSSNDQPPSWIGFFGWDVKWIETDAKHAAASSQNELSLRVIDCQRLGLDWSIRLAIPDKSSAESVEFRLAASGRRAPAAPGELLTIRIPLNSLRAWPISPVR